MHLRVFWLLFLHVTLSCYSLFLLWFSLFSVTCYETQRGEKKVNAAFLFFDRRESG